ncbi:uncharacterized protein LOC131085493 isoform X2 [Melospiza georgiana]|uniref:uncharacterized protein LOC131085493 isoform X2 n=1 Tax=Melospiza georgiana TaxID=44398 RepID=UPI0025ACD908|nr:uncharacterized protein LOC131085493 isoform X2 [Melospiza georgiana]
MIKRIFEAIAAGLLPAFPARPRARQQRSPPRTGSRGAAAMTRLCRGAGAIATLAAARPGRARASRDGGAKGGRKEPRGPCPGPAVGHPEAAAAGLSVRDGDGPSPARGNGSLQLNAQVKRAESVPSMNQAEQHGSSRERWLCPGGSRSSGWICEPAAPGCRRTQGLHTPRAYRFARIVICKWHGKCHESSCGRWLRSNDKNVLQSWVQQSSFPTRQF